MLAFNFKLCVGLVLFFGTNFILAQDSSEIIQTEKPKIQQLRARVKDRLTLPVMYEDLYLVRFLRAKNHSIADADEMIQRMLNWRRDEKMDKILSEDWSIWMKRYPFSLNIPDYQGRKAITSGIGYIDVRKVVLSGQAASLDRYLMYAFERGIYNVHEAWTRTGLIDGYLLFNLAGYSPRTHACLACMPSWLKLMINYESYYPRLAGKFLVVNTPRVFDALLNILKTVVSLHSLSNLRTYGHDKAEWSQELAKIFPPAMLPPEFGGTGPFVPAKSVHDSFRKIIYYNTTSSF